MEALRSLVRCSRDSLSVMICWCNTICSLVLVYHCLVDRVQHVSPIDLGREERRSRKGGREKKEKKKV